MCLPTNMMLHEDWNVYTEMQEESANPFKTRAYAKAIKVIGQLEEPVRSGEQVKEVSYYHLPTHRCRCNGIMTTR